MKEHPGREGSAACPAAGRQTQEKIVPGSARRTAARFSSAVHDARRHCAMWKARFLAAAASLMQAMKEAASALVGGDWAAARVRGDEADVRAPPSLSIFAIAFHLAHGGRRCRGIQRARRGDRASRSSCVVDRRPSPERLPRLVRRHRRQRRGAGCRCRMLLPIRKPDHVRVDDAQRCDAEGRLRSL